MKNDILDLSQAELKEKILELAQPAYRAGQVFVWLHKKTAKSFSDMTDLPQPLIKVLEDKFDIGNIECEEQIVSKKDRTEKFLWQLSDGSLVESVLIKAPGRKTICLSTQVGCKIKCPFCASGEKGFKRNLRVSEMLNQLYSAQRLAKVKVSNVVFMGMGEPLDNYRNVVRAIRTINHASGQDVGARKITVSTCGLIPEIKQLAEFGLQVGLSISLHSADNKTRNTIVPINRKYPLEKLISACENYTDKTGRMITLEYALMKGINDSDSDAEKLADVAREIHAKVNLIACNRTKSGKYFYDNAAGMKRFSDILKRRGVQVTIRIPKGEDIRAACGQLAGERSPQ